MSLEENVELKTVTPPRDDAFYSDITHHLKDIHSILKLTYDAFIQFQDPDREFISEEGFLLEEGLAKEREIQEIEHEAMRIAFRQKTEKEQHQKQERILRKARALVTELNKISQVWDGDGDGSLKE